MAMTFRVPENLAILLKERAKVEHLSVQRLLEKMAEDYLSRHDKRAAVDAALDRILVVRADAIRRLGE